MLNLWALQTLLQLLLTPFVTCTPVETQQTLQHRDSAEGIVSGIEWRDESGNVPVRREIRDLERDYPEQWNLYLLGLATFQWTPQNDSLSYYSLASIHGRPFRTWGNAPGLEHKLGTMSYCPHNNILFLGWHRPYLALFEEELYKQIQIYASKASTSQQERYTAAANSFRMPYWDWARGVDNGPVPDFFTSQRIEVTYPDGSKELIWNPLYAFYFHPLTPEEFSEKWRYLNATQRWPTTDAFDSVSNQTAMLESYKEQQRGLQDHIDKAFRRSTMNGFADLVEEAHGWMHGVIGGGWTGLSPKGHMWPLEYSAFEPMFMLHHTNVDRLFAMYQAAHPDRYFEAEDIGRNDNVFLEVGQTVDADTDLLPFRKSSGGFWTTNDARNTETFGYAYPETVKTSDSSDEEHQSAVIASIAQLYGSSARRILSAQAAIAGASTLLAADGTFTDWSIDTKAKPSGLPPTFVVRFSLVGDFSSDPVVDVGTWVKLMPSSHGKSSNKEGQNSTVERLYQGSVSLTSSLLDQVATGQLNSLAPKDVVPHLKDKLTWKVISGEGTTIPQSNLDAFTFEIISTKARIPNDPTAPIKYSEKVFTHPEATIGKAGGVAA